MRPVSTGPSTRPGRARAGSSLALAAVLLTAFTVSSGADGVTTPASPATGKPADAKPAGPPGSVDVMVSGQGVGVAGVKITLAPDTGKQAEMWNVGDSQPLGVVPTNATGHAIFPSVPPGRYVLTTNCLAPGNWISGSFASKVEVLPGRRSNTTLTMRRGGMIKGRVLRGGKPTGRVEIHADSPDALQSVCPTLTPSQVDTTTGEFTLSKAPLNATTWVKAYLDLGPGQASVWKEMHFEAKPETLSTEIRFPQFTDADLGSIEMTLKTDGADEPDSGSAHLIQIQPDGSWRYEASVGVGGTLVGKAVPGIPAGLYQIRANAEPGAKKWWSAAGDTIRVFPGKTAHFTVKAQLGR